jgi:hypothetical protein
MATRPQKARIQKSQKGTDIPVPKRGDFFSDLKKAATPGKSVKRGPKK